MNPAHSSELGDMASELADFTHTRSLHIMILTAKGAQLRFGSRPDHFDHVQDNDPDFAYLKPMFANLLPSGRTMFDLRQLRRVKYMISSADSDTERLLLGYDFLILIPQAIPSQPIH